MKTHSALVTTILMIFFAACSEVKPPEPAGPVPTARQMAWHQMEMNAFIHFTINTFTGKEWGYGDESPGLFNPSDLYAGQWVEILKDAGFKGVILTCKHHDGFCLWPSRFTEHSVKNSPWKNGAGNVVQEVHDACRKFGLKFGVYLSPWDRNSALYGTPAYVEYYRNQLKELFGLYSPVFEMWFDGANGGDGFYGGAREIRKIDGKNYYDWPGTLEMVRKMEPDVIFFSDAGPDIRWVGNESGSAGETNWNTITADTLYAGKPGIQKLLNTGCGDGTQWIPAEVDVSIRPGWFYHAGEDSLVKSAEKLFDIYLTSVGRGSNLLLNVPPDRRGRFHENDIMALKGFRKLLDSTFQTDLALHAGTRAGTYRGKLKHFGPANLTDGDGETFWTTNDDVLSGSVEIDLAGEKTVSYILLQEYIKLGQRVKRFSIDAMNDGKWVQVKEATTIGYKRILPLGPVKTNKIRINILEAKACPVISNIGLY